MDGIMVVNLYAMGMCFVDPVGLLVVKLSCGNTSCVFLKELYFLLW